MKSSRVRMPKSLKIVGIVGILGVLAFVMTVDSSERTTSEKVLAATDMLIEKAKRVIDKIGDATDLLFGWQQTVSGKTKKYPGVVGMLVTLKDSYEDMRSYMRENDLLKQKEGQHIVVQEALLASEVAGEFSQLIQEVAAFTESFNEKIIKSISEDKAYPRVAETVHRIDEMMKVLQEVNVEWRAESAQQAATLARFELLGE